MFFILSKTLGLLSEPLLHPVVIILCGLVLGLFWGKKIRVASFWLALLLPIIYLTLPIGQWGLMLIENTAQPSQLSHIPAARRIVVLGGFTGDGLVAAERNQPSLGSSAERLIAGLNLHKEYPEMQLIITGYSSDLYHQGWSEHEMSEKIIASLQHPQDNMLYENHSRNTYQNAANIAKTMPQALDQHLVLVTSASHMLRARAVFEKQGFTNILPYPVDYQTRPESINWLASPASNYSFLRILLHELFGLGAYWVTGRI